MSFHGNVSPGAIEVDRLEQEVGYFRVGPEGEEENIGNLTVLPVYDRDRLATLWTLRVPLDRPWPVREASSQPAIPCQSPLRDRELLPQRLVDDSQRLARRRWPRPSAPVRDKQTRRRTAGDTRGPRDRRPSSWDTEASRPRLARDHGRIWTRTTAPADEPDHRKPQDKMRLIPAHPEPRSTIARIRSHADSTRPRGARPIAAAPSPYGLRLSDDRAESTWMLRSAG
jgi:hypothetical protein